MMFLIEMFKKNRYRLFEKEFTCNISIRNRGAKFVEEVSLSYSNLQLHRDLQEGLNNGYKLGYLDLKSQESKRKQKWWEYWTGDKGVEGFFVLTNIGLVGFRKS